jgi:hypothetical protein
MSPIVRLKSKIVPVLNSAARHEYARGAEVSGQLKASAALSPGKSPAVPFGQETGWAPKPVWTPFLHQPAIRLVQCIAWSLY